MHAQALRSLPLGPGCLSLLSSEDSLLCSALLPNPISISTPSHPSMPHLSSPSATASASASAWSAVVSWLGLVVRTLLHVVSATYCSFLPSSLFSVAFKPLPSLPPDDPEISLSLATSTSTSTSPPLPASRPLDRLTVVLDLDETLVCAYETSSLTDFVRSQAAQAALSSFEIHFLSSTKEVEGKPKMNHVTVYERPGLKDFLHQLSQFADLVLFTAALEGYARPLVDHIDANNIFKLRLYRPATISTEYREHVKDLTCISKDLSRIVIVDNNPFSFLLQPLNGIPCVPFSPSQPSDDQLLSVLLPLLKELSIHRDVRPVLNCIFQMPEWFQKHGIPQSSLSS